MKRKSYYSVPYYSKRVSTSTLTGKTPARAGMIQTPGQYAALVIDPFSQPSVSIPDLSSVPCTCFSVEEQLTVPVQANGTGGFVAKIGMGFSSANYQIESSTTTDSTFAYGTATNYQFVDNFWNIYGWYRVVAAGVMVEFTGNDANNQGKIVGATFLGSNGVWEYAKTNLTALENSRQSFVGPAKDGVALVWRPKQTQDFDQLATSSVTGGSGGAYVGEFQVHFTGCAPSSSFQVRLIYHVEAIPKGGSATEGIIDPTRDPFVSPGDMSASSSTISAIDSVSSATAARYGFFTRLANAASNSIANYVAKTGWQTLVQGAVAAGASFLSYKYGGGGPPGGGP